MDKFALALLCLLSVANAQTQNVIQFRGQPGEMVNISQIITLHETQTVEVPDTCTREVPREVYECRNVQTTRQECRWVPGREECRNVPEQDCGYVNRQRYECSPGPDRQVCTDLPQRQVCVERPTREVCRIDSRGQNRCQTIGGGQSCHYVGGGQTCRNERGPEVCRTVNDREYVCQTVNRRVCEQGQGRNECYNVPHNEQVCHTETRMETDEYACTRTETQVVNIEKELHGRVNVQFIANGVREQFPIEIAIYPKDNNFQEFMIIPILRQEPRALVAAQKRRVRVLHEDDQQIQFEGDMTIETLDAPTNMVFPNALKLATINRDHKISMNIDGQISQSGKIEIELLNSVHVTAPGSSPLLGELKEVFPSQRVKIIGNKLEIDMKGLVRNLAPNMVINVKLATDVIKGEVLNADRSKIEKLFNRLVIKQQQ